MVIEKTALEQENLDTATVLTINGRLDSMAATEVKDKISSLPLHGFKNIVVDLSQVSLIDSSGISSLVAALYSTKQNNGIVKLAAPQPVVADAFQLIKFDKIFDIFADVESAAKSF